MRRLIPALAGLTLLLTACPRPTPPELPMTDPKVLSGRWAGDFVVSSRVSQARSGAGVLYALRAEAGLVLALDARSGKELARINRPQAAAIAYSPSGALFVLGGGKLTVHHPRTLAQTGTRDVPGSFLSVDGEVASPDKGAGHNRVATADSKPLPTTAAPIQDTLSDRSSDDVWWLRADRAVRAKDGLSSGGASGHGNPCALTAGLRPTSIESAGFDTQSGNAYLAGWSDGVIELRLADGTVQRTFKASAKCSAIADLYSDGQTVAYVTRAGEAGLINVQTGAVSSPHQLSETADLTVTPEGIWAKVSGAQGREVNGFQPWGAAPFEVAAEPSVAVTLDVKTTRTNTTTAEVTGSATVNGRALTVKGTLNVGGAVFAQMSPPPQGLRFNLTLLDGPTAAGTLTGNSYMYQQGPAYRSTLSLKDSFTSDGELRRP